MSEIRRESFHVKTVASNASQGTGAAVDEIADLLLVMDATLPAGAVQIESSQRVRLSTSWQGLRAEFGPYPLTNLFVQRLLDAKPTRVSIDGLHVASAELLRCAHALGLSTQCEAVSQAPTGNPHDLRWIGHLPAQAGGSEPCVRGLQIAWDYGVYSMGLRDHALLQRMNQAALDQLAGCRRVLDVGCGTGVLLDQLTRCGVSAVGVERDSACVRYARSLGLQVIEADALDFLGNLSEKFDGIVCSHFVEHLDIETLQVLIQRIAQGLEKDGMAILVFPDPESIRSQLLGFWRDPEHVRFYHPELVVSLSRVEGLVCEFNSADDKNRAVGPFSAKPPDISVETAAQNDSLWGRATRWLGLATQDEVVSLEKRLAHQAHLIEQLWRVNQTWAWEDNAVLRLRKVRA